MAHISKLIRDTFCLSYHLVDVSMGMAIYPIVYAAMGNKISKFGCKGTVYRASLEIWRNQFI